MASITVEIDDDVLEAIRKIAAARQTTVAGLIGRYLDGLVSSRRVDREKIIQELEKYWESNTLVVGERTWTREELHER